MNSVQPKYVLELFAGSQSFSKVAKEIDCVVFTSDIEPLEGIDYVCDIMEFDVYKVPFIPDIIWASPDCAAWSKAAGRIHFDAKSLVLKTPKAEKAFKIIDKTLEIIFHFLSINPELKYYIENPQGRMQKYLRAGSMYSKIPRLVVLDQCQYGREFQKTTHIFTNDMEWNPRQRCPGLDNCTHGDLRTQTTGIKKCHHIRNVKNSWVGMKTSLGVMDNLHYYERAKIPHELSLEILSYVTKGNNHA